MTHSDVLSVLERAIAERNDHNGKGGQAKVAKELGCSDSYVSQLRKRTMELNPTVIAKILEAYGLDTFECPALGQITHAGCAEERKKPFTTSRHRIHRACQACPRNGGKP